MTSFEGAFVQNSIYIGREPHAWPLTPEGWEERARAAIPEGNFGYIAGGAGSESTIRGNAEAFDRYRLRPKMLRGNAKRDLAVEVLGTRSAAPFFLGPVGGG
jgi:isopentenyl diphosphate isomerase/L-lactate dehydrogenase-like FMN-dependent dehydrogenase